MKKITALCLASIIFMLSCKPFDNSVNITPNKAPIAQNNIIYSYSADLLNDPDSHIQMGWAKRKNVQVLNLKITNISKTAIHGTQFKFYSNGQPLTIVNNQIASKKLKTKTFPKVVYMIPVLIVGIVIYAGLMSLIDEDDDYDGDGFSDSSPKVRKAQEDPLVDANPIQKGLYQFNIAEHIIKPGATLSGLIAFESEKEITSLNIKVSETSFIINENP